MSWIIFVQSVLITLALALDLGSMTTMNKLGTKTSIPLNPELSMLPTQIIRFRGYPAETHPVVTEDGYILELHRIPSRFKKNAKPIFLMYGYFGTDAIWSITPANRSLAYILSDLGYDVWMGNSRGNTYSRKHITLDPEEEQYWNFSWDEMGRYDIPASLNYVLETTRQEKLVFIGNSFGCTLFFIAMSSRPELNQSIDVMVALAPVTTMAKTRSLPLRLITHFYAPIQLFLKVTRTRAFGDMVSSPWIRSLQRLVCERTYEMAAICREILFSLIGANRKNFDLKLIPMIHQYIPHGVSLNSLTQFIQHVNSAEKLKAFDYGWEENKKRYGSKEPPVYNLSLVTAPVYIFWGSNDLLVVPEDVGWLTSQLGNVKASIRVSDPHFNHFDFLIGSNVYEVLYRHVIDILPKP